MLIFSAPADFKGDELERQLVEASQGKGPLSQFADWSVVFVILDNPEIEINAFSTTETELALDARGNPETTVDRDPDTGEIIMEQPVDNDGKPIGNPIPRLVPTGRLVPKQLSEAEYDAVAKVIASYQRSAVPPPDPMVEARQQLQQFLDTPPNDRNVNEALEVIAKLVLG